MPQSLYDYHALVFIIVEMGCTRWLCNVHTLLELQSLVVSRMAENAGMQIAKENRTLFLP